MRRIVIVLVLGICTACSGPHFRVKYLPQPGYPEQAVVGNIQGTVTVTVCFGVDGKVSQAGSVGTNKILEKAAEENARQWVFGRLPSRGEYPMCHTIDYVYKLEGKPLAVVTPPFVRTDLPGRLEIVSHPFFNDNPPTGLTPPKTSAPKESPQKQTPSATNAGHAEGR